MIILKYKGHLEVWLPQKLPPFDAELLKNKQGIIILKVEFFAKKIAPPRLALFEVKFTSFDNYNRVEFSYSWIKK